MREGRDLVINGELVLSGYVMSDEHASWAWEDEIFFCPRMVREGLLHLGEGEVVVRLNSIGGDPVAGEAIRSVLAGHPGGVRIVVEGCAASAASLLLMGGRRREMTAGSWIMIHNPSAWVSGGADELRAQADVLDMLARIYGQVYAQASGQTVDDIITMMAAETYMDADAAIAAGFIHALAAADAPPPEVPEPPAAVPPSEVARTEMRDAMTHWGAMMRACNPVSAPGAEVIAASSRGTPAPAAITMEATMPTLTTPAPGQDPATQTQTAVMAERRRVTDIRQMATPFMAAGRLTEADVQALIDDGTSAEAAGSRLMATMAAREPVGSNIAPAPRGRDETETRRMAMEDSLVLRLSGSPIEDQTRAAAARQYMDHSLVEMAAGRLGHSRVPGNFAGREEVLRMAFLSTSDFPALFENALNRSLAARYAQATPTYRRIARQRTYVDFRAHTTVRVGDFPEMQPVSPEGGEVKAGKFSEAKETTSVTAYGIQVPISRQMLVNDSLGGIQQILNDRGAAVARFEEKTFYAMMLGGSNADGPTLVETSRQVFNTTDNTKSSSGGAIGVTTVSVGRAKMMAQTSSDGGKLGLYPTILLCGPDKLTEAEQLVATIQPTQASNVNVFSGRLDPVSTPWITGNAWYLFADPGAAACFEWGLLDGYSAPRFRMDEPFGVQGVAFSLEHDFGCGAIDFRAGYKNAGA